MTEKSDARPGKVEKRKHKQVAPPEFASYIAKLHKAQQSASNHPDSRTISKEAVMALEGMADHLVNLLVENGKRVKRFTKSDTFKLDDAKAAATLALTGHLRQRAMDEGQAATEKHRATLLEKPPRNGAATAN